MGNINGIMGAITITQVDTTKINYTNRMEYLQEYCKQYYKIYKTDFQERARSHYKENKGIYIQRAKDHYKNHTEHHKQTTRKNRELKRLRIVLENMIEIRLMTMSNI